MKRFVNKNSAKRVTLPDYVANTVDSFFDWLEDNHGDTDYIGNNNVASWTRRALDIRLNEYCNYLEQKQLEAAREMDSFLTQSS